jgi:hypothetical protein
MAKLSAAEILKYDWRYNLIKDKIKNKSDFELVLGSKVKIISYDEAIYDKAYKLRNAKELNNVLFFDDKGKQYKLTDFNKNKEFGGGGGSGAGAALTKMSESAQAYYCAALWAGRDFSPESLLASKATADCDEPIKNVIEKLPEDWIDSCIKGAKELYSLFGSNENLTFHRGSVWVNKLSSKFSQLNQIGGKYFSNINKWTPADIWLIDKQLIHDNTIFSLISLTDVNQYLTKMLDEKKLIGVSLKKIGQAPHTSYKNYNVNNKNQHVYAGYSVGKKEFFKSGDGYIKYTNGSSGEIQLRYFTAAASSWQGEIKGKYANQGKVGGGVLQKIVKKYNTLATLSTPSTMQTVYSSKNNVEKFYNYYKNLVDNPINIKEFALQISKKDAKWFGSKFLSAEIIYYIQSSTKKNEIISSILDYAASQSELSAPFVKLE